MSYFNRFCAKAQKALRRAGDRAEEVLDNASKTVKIKALEIRMDEQYENLGRLVYLDLHTEENLEEAKLQVIATLDALFDELSVLKAEGAAASTAAEPTESAEIAETAEAAAEPEGE